MAIKTFINLPVKDLKKSIEFFTQLGFKFNPQFTDDTATCMIISDNSYVMLLTEGKFKEFITKEICDSTKSKEVLIALAAESKEQVDDIVDKALESGGTVPMELKENDFMYYRTFEDLDGHHWEVLWMEPSTVS